VKVREIVRESAARTIAGWHTLRADLVVPDVYRARIDEHLGKLPLARLG
jgi:hypothetical protein